MTVPLGNPFALGAGPTVQTSARTDRIAIGASFRPSSAALGAVSGFLAGPAGTMGELTLLTDVLLRVNPFTAIVQGTHNSTQGQYVVPNAVQRDLAVPAKDASLFRRALIAVRVADSLEAGVATSAATDGAWLEVIPGAAVASNPQLPATPANAVLAGELSIPSIASGLPVTITKYDPRTTGRGGILPVLNDTSTIPGHGAAPGAYPGEYRDHPVYGLQRWNAAGAGQWQATGIVEMTSAARQAIPAADRFPRLTVYETDTDLLVRWTGTYWRLISAQTWGTQGVVNNNWAGTAYAWVAGLGAKITIPADGIRREWAATITSNLNGDGWWRYRVDRAANAALGLAAATSYFPNTTGFRNIMASESGAGFQAFGTLAGDQEATCYLEARANAANSAGFVIPIVRLQATAG